MKRMKRILIDKRNDLALLLHVLRFVETFGNRRELVSGVPPSDKYVDLSLGTNSHAGTELDPYSYYDMHTAILLGTPLHFRLKGSASGVVPLSWPSNANRYLFQFEAWSIPLYGPWRLDFDNPCNLIGTYKNAILNVPVGVTLAYGFEENDQVAFYSCYIVSPEMAIINNPINIFGSTFKISGNIVPSDGMALFIQDSTITGTFASPP